MSDPSLDLQKAIVAAMKASPTVTALVGGRIYDRVPKGAVFPYVSFGSDQVLSDDTGCSVGYEVFLTLDIWSRATGYPEVKRVSGAIRAALHDAELPLDDHAMVLLEHRQTRYFTDPDGITRHGAAEFRTLLEAVEPA